jgi:hypothetical protein
MNNQYDPIIVLCEQCKEHGHFNMPGVNYSLEFCSIEGAKEVLASEHIAYHLHYPEIQKLREEIEKLDLPRIDFHAAMNIVADVRSWNIEFKEALENNIVLQYAAHDHHLHNPQAQAAQVD